MKFGFVGKNSLHNIFICLRKQAATAIENRGNFCSVGLVVVKKSPVSIVAVKISEQRIHDKDIPEMLPQFYRRYILLLVNGVHHIFQFRAAAVAIRVENCVF